MGYDLWMHLQYLAFSNFQSVRCASMIDCQPKYKIMRLIHQFAYVNRCQYVFTLTPANKNKTKILRSLANGVRYLQFNSSIIRWQFHYFVFNCNCCYLLGRQELNEWRMAESTTHTPHPYLLFYETPRATGGSVCCACDFVLIDFLLIYIPAHTHTHTQRCAHSVLSIGWEDAINRGLRAYALRLKSSHNWYRINVG